MKVRQILPFALPNPVLFSLVYGRQAAKKKVITFEFISDDILEVDRNDFQNRWKPTNTP